MSTQKTVWIAAPIHTGIILSTTKARCYLVIAPLRLLTFGWQGLWRLSIPSYEHLQRHFITFSAIFQRFYFIFKCAKSPCFCGTSPAAHFGLDNKGGRALHRLFHLPYFAYWLRPIWNRSLPWLSTATVRGRFSTSIRFTDSHPSSSKAMTWADLMHLAMRAPAPPTAAK